MKIKWRHPRHDVKLWHVWIANVHPTNNGGINRLPCWHYPVFGAECIDKWLWDFHDFINGYEE